MMELPAADGIDPVPPERRTLSGLDQAILWSNLGVSLVGVVTGALLVPALSFAQGLAAVLLGGIAGGAMIAGSAWLGASTALPGMAILRRALGDRGSLAPSALNVLQNTGWSAVETFFVAESARRIVGEGPRLAYFLAAGLAGIALAVIGPLSVVRRLLRRIVTPFVVAALVYVVCRLALEARCGIAGRGGLTFAAALDVVVAYNAGWLPLAPDYTRFSSRPLRAAAGAAGGYFAGTTLVMVAGLLAGTLGGPGDPIAAVSVMLGLAGGLAAAAIVVADESEKTFANVYSTAVSLQNIVPRLPQRLAIVAVGSIATVIAWLVTTDRYVSFLFLLGAVFLPLFGAVIADRLRPAAPGGTLAAWALGFVLYEWIQPSTIDAVGTAERHVASAFGAPLPLFGGSVGASLPAFALAFVVRAAWPSRAGVASASGSRLALPGRR
jgi:putative hydroxymethylpyrimidine transporter CytX